MHGPGVLLPGTRPSSLPEAERRIGIRMANYITLIRTLLSFAAEDGRPGAERELLP